MVSEQTDDVFVFGPNINLIFFISTETTIDMIRIRIKTIQMSGLEAPYSMNEHL